MKVWLVETDETGIVKQGVVNEDALSDAERESVSMHRPKGFVWWVKKLFGGRANDVLQ